MTDERAIFLRTIEQWLEARQAVHRHQVSEEFASALFCDLLVQETNAARSMFEQLDRYIDARVEKRLAALTGSLR